jgi:hypothetical protein
MEKGGISIMLKVSLEQRTIWNTYIGDNWKVLPDWKQVATATKWQGKLVRVAHSRNEL